MANYFYVANGNGHLQVSDTTNIPVRISRSPVSNYPKYDYPPSVTSAPYYITMIPKPTNAIFATFSCDGTDCSDYWFRVLQESDRVIFQSPSDSSKRSNIYVNFYGLARNGSEAGNSGLRIFDESGALIFSSLQKQMIISEYWEQQYSIYYNRGYRDYSPEISENAYPKLTFSRSYPIEVMANSASHAGGYSSAMDLPWFEIAHALAFTNDKEVKMKPVCVGDAAAAFDFNDFVFNCTHMRSQFIILKGGNY